MSHWLRKCFVKHTSILSCTHPQLAVFTYLNPALLLLLSPNDFCSFSFQY